MCLSHRPLFSPKMALRSFSSGESWVSPLGVTLPTNISPGLTSAPSLTIPLSSRSLRASSPTFGISRVISSLPSFVSLATTSNSSMCTRCVNAVSYKSFADKNRIFKIVTAPRHKGNGNVFTSKPVRPYPWPDHRR